VWVYHLFWVRGPKFGEIRLKWVTSRKSKVMGVVNARILWKLVFLLSAALDAEWLAETYQRPSGQQKQFSEPDSLSSAWHCLSADTWCTRLLCAALPTCSAVHIHSSTHIHTPTFGTYWITYWVLPIQIFTLTGGKFLWIGARCFRVAAQRLWNNLPVEFSLTVKHKLGTV